MIKTYSFVSLFIVVCIFSAAQNDFGSQVVNVGWHEEFLEGSGWQPEPWLVRDQDPEARSSFGDGGGKFEISTPRMGMAWTKTLNPIWVQEFPILEVDYEISGATSDTLYRVLLLSDDSTGPITPGALNPENPLASGSKTGVGSGETGSHILKVDLREIFSSDRVARISIVLAGGRSPAKLTIRRLAFLSEDASRPESGVEKDLAQFLFPDMTEQEGASPTGNWKSVKLPTTNRISAEWVAKAYSCSVSWPKEREFIRNGIRFELDEASKAVLATGVMETTSIEVHEKLRGKELAILLGVRAYGNSKPWYRAVKRVPREPIASPHELIVELEYSDGTHRLHFPWSVERQQYAVERRPQAYIVPLEDKKELVRFAVEDRMNYGQVFLLSASVNTSEQAAYPELRTETRLARAKETPKIEPSPPRCEVNEGRLVVETCWLRLSADLKSGFRANELLLRPYNRNLLVETADLYEIKDEQGTTFPLKLSDARATAKQGSQTARTAMITWDVGEFGEIHELTLELVAEESGQIRITPTLKNEGKDSWKVVVSYPRITHLKIASQMADAYYMLGTRNTAIGNSPMKSNERYSGRHPLQMMDVYSGSEGGGLAILVEDDTLQEKNFVFEQGAGSTDMAVVFPHVTIPSKGSIALPPVALYPHGGDWRQAFEAYRQWAQKALVGERTHYGLDHLFFCRRDYPLGGTDYLYEVRSMRYAPERLLEESEGGFGGIDMIDISGWAYNDKTGRVGNYLVNDLGGLSELARCVRTTHEKGHKLGLYFEGYLVDRRAPLAERALPNWQIIKEDGQGKWWAGNMEFFVCPGVKEWREALSDMIVEVAQQTGADAVYTDEYGFSSAALACWSPNHGHPVPSNPPLEEQKMLQLIREKLDARSLQVAIYCEQMPCDGLLGNIDGAFNYGMSSAQESQHPTKLQLVRFAFPQVAMMEMISQGIRPVPVAVDDLHLCFFHGLAIWLKGRSQSWYSPEFRDFAERIEPIYKQHAEAFRSPDCSPLLPTLRAQLYANRFATPQEVIITLYNSRYEDISGDLIEVDLQDGWSVYDLFTGEKAELRRNGNRVVIQGMIEPHSSGAFLLTGAGTASSE
ncbi:MAG: DUF6259 domain-containing protein [bacterium]